MQGGAASLGAFLEAAPPPLYLVYMLAAGVGFPCSEDALVVRITAALRAAETVLSCTPIPATSPSHRHPSCDSDP